MIRSLEVPVGVFAVIDASEHEARHKAGIGPIANLRTLAALSELPHGIQVPLASLASEVLCRLPEMPAVRLDSNVVQRRVRPPARLVGAVTGAAAWREAATALGAFVTTAPRVTFLGADEPLSTQIEAEALLWEIGLVRRGEMPEVLLLPGEPVVEHGPFQWWLAESAYAAWLASQEATGRPRPPVAA